MVYVGIIHIVVCIIVGIAYKMGKIQTKAVIMPSVILVPFVGIILLFQNEWMLRKRKLGEKQIIMDTLKIQDVMYKRIEVSESTNESITVPLEEAMIVNDTNVRRKLMLDILHRNPENNIELLQKARLTDDTELSHYATTAMMNIQSHYEMEIHDLEEKQKKFPNDQRLLRSYRRELKKYIDSDLISGMILQVYQRKLDQVLQQLMKLEPLHENYQLDYLENRIRIGQTDNMEEHIREVLQKWPGDERIYKIFVSYASRQNDGKLVQDILHEIKDKKIYFSSSGKEWFQFWNNEGNIEE